METPLTILVNSTDSFEDCWEPFFKLFSTYWPDCPYPIVLNTETRRFSYGGLDIACSKVAADRPGKPLAWGKCLIRCLERIETDVVLYVQEDYFLHAPVKVRQIEEFAEMMHPGGYACIRLLECGGAGPWHPSAHHLLWEVDRKSRYRLSLQAALWRKDRLRAYLRPHESPWHFEVWGSRRARRVQDRIACVNRDVFNDRLGQVFPYVPTGIVKGRWNRQVVADLFSRHGIEVDFSRRGFYDPCNPVKQKKAPLVRRAWARVRSLV